MNDPGVGIQDIQGGAAIHQAIPTAPGSRFHDSSPKGIYIQLVPQRCRIGFEDGPEDVPCLEGTFMEGRISLDSFQERRN